MAVEGYDPLLETIRLLGTASGLRYWTLQALRAGPQTVLELADRLGRYRGTVRYALRGLVACGLVSVSYRDSKAETRHRSYRSAVYTAAPGALQWLDAGEKLLKTLN